MSLYLVDFITACFVMALGIGTDVAITTVLRAKQLKSMKVAIFWVVGVSLTHTIFPMLGYLLTYFSIQAVPVLTPTVGLLAFLLISHFLYNEFKDIANDSQPGDDNHIYISFALILAVSWDALWSGPAKSAQVVNWPEIMVWGSFLIVGVLVTVTCLLSWWLGTWVVERSSMNMSPKVKLTALWVQYSVIAYFGVLALSRYTFELSVNWWHILSLTSFAVAVMLTILTTEQKQVKSEH